MCKLYKYCSFETAVKILLFNPAYSFNDPYDCHINIKLNLPETELLACMRTFYKKGQIESAQAIKETLLTIKQQAKEKIGISCFSESGENILMFSHYADKHRGACLVFADNKISKDCSRIEKVNYAEEPFQLAFDRKKLLTLFEEGKEIEYASLLVHKYNIWEYEQEYRAIAKAGTLAQFDAAKLIEIHLGYAMNDCSKRVIAMIIKNRYPHCKIYEMELHNHCYKLQKKAFAS